MSGSQTRGGAYLVVSSDCHAGPPADQYRQYMDPVHRERYDQFLQELVSVRAVQMAHVNNAQKMFREKFVAKTGDGGIRACWDAELREKEIDNDGIAGEVIFPDADVLGIGGITSSPFGTGLAASGHDDPVLAMAGALAHNRWLADLCAASPGRRAGIATVPIIHDIPAAVQEIGRAHAAGVWGGVMIPTQWAPYPSYNDPRYDPVWATCQELGMAVTVHSGGSPRDVTVGPGALPIYSCEAWFFAARPLWSMIWGGVFERFPQLNFAVTEDGAWWAPEMLARLDDQWHGFHATLKFGDVFRDALPEPPSFYFQRNCFLGVGMTEAEMNRRHEIGIDQIMWGNDFPHPEGTWPHTREWLRIKFHDVPEDETRKILGLNALRAYNFDAEKLAAIAARIGPTPEEIHDQPVPANPDRGS
jgi:predicted TIM-barrel fold metal-dependent hydrolase